MRLIQKIYSGLIRACGLIAGALIGVLTALVCYDVIGRNVGFGSVPWIVEVAEYMLPVGTCFAAPWLMYQNQHVKLDLLNMVLTSTALARIERAAGLVGALVCAVVTWYAFVAIADSRSAGTLMMKALVFPEWWLMIPLPIGFGLLAIECLRRFLGGQTPEPAPGHADRPGDDPATPGAGVSP